MHNLKTCLRNRVINVLDEGETNDKGEPLVNVMQMLHGAYNLQNCQEDEELKQLWAYLSEAADEKFKIRGANNDTMVVSCGVCMFF